MVYFRLGRNKQAPGCCGGCLFGLMFCGVSLVFIGVGLYGTWHQIHARTVYVPVTATVLSSDVRISSDSDGTTYYPDIEYQYEVDGKTYIADQYQPITVSKSRRKSEEISGQYQPGDTITVYYNPAKPAEAAMVMSFSWFPIFFSAFALPFFAIGAYVALASLFGWTFGIRRKKGTVMTPTASVPATGMVTLKPASSLIGGICFFIVFALFWNGISWTVFLAFLSDNNWQFKYVLLFIGIFPLIGLALAVGILYALFVKLRWKGVKVRGTSPLQPGGVFEYEVTLPANCPSHVEEYRTSIRCIEEVKYRVGTDTRTVTQVIYESEIERENDIQGAVLSAAPRTGALAFPEDAMHSFKSSNNQIRWEFTLKIAAPSGPDLKAQYVIELLPSGT